MILTGTGVSGGSACAPLYVLPSRGSHSAPVSVRALVPGTWGERLTESIEAARAELAAVVADVTARLGPEEAGIFKAHELLLDDDEWRGEIERLVAGGIAAPAAVRQVSDAVAAELRELDDDYLRERAADVLDVAQRVLRHLGVDSTTPLPTAADGEVVLAALELMPSDTLGLDPAVVRAIVTERGTRTSHAAILARQLGIPAVVSVSGLLAAVEPAVRQGVLCAVDADAGTCELDPDPGTAERHRTARNVVEVCDDPVRTADGVDVAVYGNAASAEEVAAAVSYGADGIGLFRTELLLSGTMRVLDEEGQVAAYTAAAVAAGGRPVVFRTFDVGGDKPVDGLSVPHEDNPFLGLRGVRLCLDRKDVFATQLRALARVARDHSNVHVMVPMVSGLEELDAVDALLGELAADHRLSVGAMVEVPSVAVLAREFAARCDFLSVGTNDLTAYLLAADRNNPNLGSLYNDLHPAVIRVISAVLDAGREAGVKVSVCGELAGDPHALPLLVGLGLRAFSAAPPIVPRLKQLIREIDSRQAARLAERVLRASRVEEVAHLLATWPFEEASHAAAPARPPASRTGGGDRR
ncbi:phosphoenolpyruvate--protein phosphotransferase [Microbispora sp. H11081]|uniref:phosphoenolpyruvate--protein phosphotransferase n=1 Tax=Microbispora sp. H11081 TaxID=2729107 RepID=UPI001473AFE3|nr:phosphoenolpyruvate--protein phosphotransferase [Microbispora sp. H11081]